MRFVDAEYKFVGMIKVAIIFFWMLMNIDKC